MHEIPERYTGDAARAAFRGELPDATINPRLVKWFNDWSGSTSALLIGPSGCGKTLAAALAAQSNHQWIRRQPGQPSVISVSRARPDGAFLRSVQVTRWIRADKLSRLLSDRDTTPELERIIDAPLLVIDELGYERFSETVLEAIGTRDELGRPTIATSGMKHQELQARYSDATIRRLSAHMGATMVNCHQPTPDIKIAPRWPVDVPPARQRDGSATNTHRDPKSLPVTNPEAAKTIRKFVAGF